MRQLIRKFWLSGVVAIALILTCASIASANVSLKNGNFFIGYIDAFYSGGFEPKIERVYNSKTAYKGMFGWGWGTEYEVYLSVSADGSVVVHEYGGGAENRFSPTNFKMADLDAAVEKIGQVAQQTGTIGSGSQLAAYKKKLKEDASFRNQEWEKFLKTNQITVRKLATGTQLVSAAFSFQYITKIQDGYQRNFESGRVEKFDERGKLVQILDKNGNFIKFEYGKDGRLAKLIDNYNRKMFLSYNNHGLVDKIQIDGGKASSYSYNTSEELAQSKDVDGNTYTYKYTADGMHNLAEVGYSDKTAMKVTYYGPEKDYHVKSVRERDGRLYDYEYQKGSGGALAVGVSVKTEDGKPISSSKYEYTLKRKTSGEEWTYKMVSNIDGDRTETIYNECCGLPLVIKRGDEETSFQYNARGNVTKKITGTDVTELEYDPKVNKVSKVVRYSKTQSKQKSWSMFTYDEKGNLTFAKNSDSKGVKLFYDMNGRIRSMLDQSRRRIDFKYNENSKPIEITDPQLGSITVSYGPSGEIKKVESSAGRKIAVQVTSAFQNLLEIIRPAGVSLSF